MPLSCGLGTIPVTALPSRSCNQTSVQTCTHPHALVPQLCSLAGAELAPTWMLCWVRMLCPRPVCMSLPSAPTPAAACGPLGPPSGPKPSSRVCSAASAEACARALRKFQKDQRLGQCVPAGQRQRQPALDTLPAWLVHAHVLGACPSSSTSMDTLGGQLCGGQCLLANQHLLMLAWGNLLLPECRTGGGLGMDSRPCLDWRRVQKGRQAALSLRCGGPVRGTTC